MKYTIVFDRLTEETLTRASEFLKAASQIEDIVVDEKTLSVIVKPEKEKEIKELASKYNIADLTWIKS